MEILKYAWNEKREKIMRNGIYPLGISICLDGKSFDCHDIVYGILNLLRQYPKQSFIWAQNWGRTTVWVHPTKGFSFCFTLDESSEEKLGVLVSTISRITPKISLLEPSKNIGLFKIILNDEPITLEGAILQVERMVDETVWCHYLFLKKELGYKDDATLYRQAIKDVWDNGIFIEYMEENQIIELKRQNLDLPIRIYGDVLSKNLVPAVIGAVILPKHVQLSDRVTELYDIKHRCIARQKENVRVKQKPIFHLTVCENKKSLLVGCGFTFGKLLHAGHLLLLAFAEMIRRTVSSDLPLFVESNDTGDRIAGLIAKCASTQKISIEEAVHFLVDKSTDPKTIQSMYRHRISDGALMNEALNWLSRNTNSFSILQNMENIATKTLKQIGLSQIQILKDSFCTRNIIFDSPVFYCGWPSLGFCFVKYLKGKHKKMIVTHKRGLATASLARMAFVENVRQTTGSKETFIFVDADPSVGDASDLLELNNRKGITRIKGVGIGFGMSLASGTTGDAPSIEDICNEFKFQFSAEENPLLSMLSYFLLTRFMTVPSFKHNNDAARASLQGLSFFDYKDHKSFAQDLMSAYNEMTTFKKRVNEAQIKIYQNQDDSIPDLTPLFVRKFEKLEKSKDISVLFPDPVAVAVDKNLRRYLDIGLRQTSDNFSDINLFTQEVITAYVNGCRTISDFDQYLVDKGILLRPVRGEMVISIVSIESLKQRGYSQKEQIKHGCKYVLGKCCLIKKRHAYFDILVSAIEEVDSLKAISRNSARDAINALKKITRVIFGPS